MSHPKSDLDQFMFQSSRTLAFCAAGNATCDMRMSFKKKDINSLFLKQF